MNLYLTIIMMLPSCSERFAPKEIKDASSQFGYRTVWPKKEFEIFTSSTVWSEKTRCFYVSDNYENIGGNDGRVMVEACDQGRPTAIQIMGKDANCFVAKTYRIVAEEK